MIECKCGCGEMFEPKIRSDWQQRYIFGHGNRGRKFPGLKHDKQFKAGHSPWNKSVHVENAGTYKKGHPQVFFKHSKQSRAKMSEAQLGRLTSYKGERHWNWQGGKSRADKNERTKFLKYIVPKVFNRDDYTCQICSQYSGYLHVDHIKAWADYPELRFDMSNCRTLCRACHYYITFKRKMPNGSRWGLTTVPSALDRKGG